jgi:hypothetical protein
MNVWSFLLGLAVGVILIAGVTWVFDSADARHRAQVVCPEADR